MAAISGRSFIATLTSNTGDGVFPIGYLRDDSIAGSGWLIQRIGKDAIQRPMAFRFDFIEEAGNRLYYHISAAPGTEYAGAKLGISRNGYLGFYSIAEVTDYWKIELANNYEHPDYFDFVLRDSKGHRVASVNEPKGGFWTGIGKGGSPSKRIRFLNVYEGDILYLQARILEDV